MKFLIQQNLLNKDLIEKCKQAITEFDHEFINVIPFSRKIECSSLLKGKDFIPYGSTLLTNIALHKKWTGLHFDLNNFSMSSYIKNRDDMLNNELILTVKDSIEYLETLSSTDIFIRPDLDLKHFSGQIINSKEALEWFKDANSQPIKNNSYAMKSTMNIVISKPKHIEAEFRWFIVDRKIVSGSSYRINGILKSCEILDKNEIKKAQHFADKWLPNDCCVMDLGLVNNELKVIEFNCINASGFYNHNIYKIFKELNTFHNMK